MRTYLPAAVAIAILFLSMPLAGAHTGKVVYSTNTDTGYAYTKACRNTDTLTPLSKVCSPQTYNVPVGAVHLHLIFIFPYGGAATLEANLKERTPVFGDMVTYLDTVCSTGVTPYLQDSQVTCVGGQMRDWHTGVAHSFSGRGNEAYCVPTHCDWFVGVLWY